MVSHLRNYLREFPAKNGRGILAVAAYVLTAQAIFGYICPSMWLLGLPCPACGLTRAAFSLLRLDFRMAASYNPMIFFVLPALYFYKKGRALLFAGVTGLMFAVFFLRVLTSFGVEPLIINKSALMFILLNHTGGVF